MTDTSTEAAWDALMAYQQADMDGIMVLVSRQAIHECRDDRDTLAKQLAEARNAALEEAALWAESEGLFRTRDEIRALKSTSAEGEG